MTRIAETIQWKHYVRNRLIELLRRTGSKHVFEELNYGNKVTSVAEMVSHLDFSQRSLLHSIEKYALHTPENEQIFASAQQSRIPTTEGPIRFSDSLHENFTWIVGFISHLKKDDLALKIDHPAFRNFLTVGWVIELMTLQEQSAVSEIQTVLNYHNIPAQVPWATAKYSRPVEKLIFK
jgi:hypothetical protein